MNPTPIRTTIEALSQSEQIGAAERLLRAGNWRKAERLCLKMIEQGANPDAMRLLGRLNIEAGRPSAALPWLQKVVSLEPASAAARFALATALQSLGNMREAAGAWLAGIEIDPCHVFAHICLADALMELGLYDAAATAASQALLVDPKSADAYDRLGSACEKLGKRSEAIDYYSRSLAIRPNSPDIRRRLASIFRAEGRLKSARQVFEELVREHPRNTGMRFELAGVLIQAGEKDQAAAELRHAIRLQPRFPEALNNLGTLLRAGGGVEEAESCYRTALAQKPDYAIAWNNLGNLCVEVSRLDQAERSYAKALSIDPGYAEAHTNRALLWLLQGRFSEGWEEYEWRWQQAGTARRALAQPAWDGAPIAGKVILLHSEQGAGDTIQFIRYARMLQRQGASVALHCQPSLKRLLTGMPELTAVVSGSTPLPRFDVHAPLMSLPRLFGTSESTIPDEVPYLSPVPDSVVPEPLRDEGVMRVGLVWAGNPDHRNDRNRSFSPELLRGLVRRRGVRFFSLQVDNSCPSCPEFDGNLTDLSHYLVDYAATAACLERLDLLITVDTSVAHLAGALGRPVWLLLPTCNDWRWLRSRRDTRWYPTMRLFRQAVLGDWQPVLQEVSVELEAAAESHARSTLTSASEISFNGRTSALL